VRGKVHGAWLDGTARILEDRGEIDRALGALRAKYGLQAAVTDFFSRLTGRFGRRAYLEVTLKE
jgi:hypothetical protein